MKNYFFISFNLFFFLTLLSFVDWEMLKGWDGQTNSTEGNGYDQKQISQRHFCPAEYILSQNLKLTRKQTRTRSY